MGIKDWLAKNAGVAAYGAVMGREAVKNGLALGRCLYLGHGTHATASGVLVFEDDDQMKAKGFTLYCPDPMDPPPLEDPSELSKHTRAAGVAFATTCTVLAACSVMNEVNASAFIQSMGSAVRMELRLVSPVITPDLLNSYSSLPNPTEIILDLERPGTQDLLGVFVEEVVKKSGTGPVGFQRSGVMGFDAIAVPLLTETLTKVRDATQKFGW